MHSLYASIPGGLFLRLLSSTIPNSSYWESGKRCWETSKKSFHPHFRTITGKIRTNFVRRAFEPRRKLQVFYIITIQKLDKIFPEKTITTWSNYRVRWSGIRIWWTHRKINLNPRVAEAPSEAYVGLPIPNLGHMGQHPQNFKLHTHNFTLQQG